jgi:PAS domain-containing protein
MKSANKQNKEQIDELEVLRERIAELERQERISRQILGDFGKRTDRFFPRMAHMHEAIFVIFDRKFEFVNDKFAELFGVSPEEICSSDFDPMTLIAPESRSFIREQYREWCCGAFTTKQFKYTGLSKEGLRIKCETFLLLIPYKWGISIQGTLRSISVGRPDEAFQKRYSEYPVVLQTVPAGVMYADSDNHFMHSSKISGESKNLLMEQINRADYLGKPANIRR